MVRPNTKILVDARGTQEGFKAHKRRGIGHYAQHLLTHLISQTDILEWSLLVEEGREVESFLRAPQVTFEAVKANRFLSRTGRLAEQQLRVSQALRMTHARLAHFLGQDDATLWAAIPYVVTVHDTITLSANTLYSRADRVKHQVVQSISRRIVRRAAAVITISEHSKRDIQTHYQIPGDNIFVTPLGVDDRFLHECSADQVSGVLTKYGLQKPYFFYIGGIDPRKNVPRILSALSTLLTQGATNLTLAMAGDLRTQREYPLLESLIKQLGLENVVLELGYVADDDLPMIMKGARALVFPSLYEGFGLPVLQAMAVGTPVITSKLTSIPEVAGDAALYIDPYRPESIAQAMQIVLDDPQSIRQIVGEGRRRSRQFSWENTAKETISVYETVLNQLERAR